MKKNTLAIFDRDEEYVMRLMNYLNDSRSMPLEIQAFTDKKLLKDYVKEHEVDILLLPEEELDDDLSGAKTGEMMVLSEADSAQDCCGHRSICKYQSSENILREVMCYYADRPASVPGLLPDRKTEITAVYSPIRRCFRTSFAIAMGQVLSERERVLYINLEEYSGFNQLLRKNYMTDLSDLLFYIGQKKRNFPCKLASMVQSLGGLDFIPPAVSPPDLRTVDEESWITFFNEVLRCDYSRIILDFGESAAGFLNILSECGTIYTPVREDTVSLSKLEQYEAMLHILEYETILSRTEKISIPYFREMNGRIETLSQSPLGDYVRQLLLKEKHGSAYAGGGTALPAASSGRQRRKS